MYLRQCEHCIRVDLKKREPCLLKLVGQGLFKCRTTAYWNIDAACRTLTSELFIFKWMNECSSNAVYLSVSLYCLYAILGTEVQKCTLFWEMYKLCINAPVVSRKYSFTPHNSDVWAVYSVCLLVCWFMHEWVMVTGLLVRQALWHYDRMRSPRCRMTRSPRQPLFGAHITHAHTHTHPSHHVPE